MDPENWTTNQDTLAAFRRHLTNADVICETDHLAARMSLLKAELDAAEKESDRIALYKKTLDALKKYEEVATARKAAARGTELSTLKVKARRLEIEISLEQANIKETKESR
ncbi:hypothetical protein [Fimbriiglobus ruber]|nr:hypothetical protein [Fimbriiglobus ruber]